MRRSDLILSILASAEGRSLSPVQLQKAAFLITQNIGEVVNDGPGFSFSPYDYGPFDKAVYDEATALSWSDLAVISPSGNGRWNVYSASDKGIVSGKQLLANIEDRFSKYITDVTAWVRAQTFNGLVKSIYDLYPDMKVNSVFQD